MALKYVVKFRRTSQYRAVKFQDRLNIKDKVWLSYFLILQEHLMEHDTQQFFMHCIKNSVQLTYIYWNLYRVFLQTERLHSYIIIKVKECIISHNLCHKVQYYLPSYGMYS